MPSGGGERKGEEINVDIGYCIHSVRVGYVDH